MKSIVKFLGLILLVVASAYATILVVTRHPSLLPSTIIANENVQNQSAQPTYAETPWTGTERVINSAPTSFSYAAELSVNAVVHVKTTYTAQTQYRNIDPLLEFFFGPQGNIERQQPVATASGSGVIVSQDGYIVTNNHVIDKASQIEVVLNDKRSFAASLVGTDPSTDIALLKIEADSLPTITMGNSDALRLGEWVLAIGNPFNLTSTVTAGIVSAKARNINILNDNMKIESFIQTDAAVNPGNSGGALVNGQGELVGINTAIASQTGSYAGYAFAVPVNIVKKVVNDIKQYGTVQRAVLGVQIQEITDELKRQNHLTTLQGAYVAGVVEGSAAAVAGIKVGDVLTAINGQQVRTSAELQELIGRCHPGDIIQVNIIRGNDAFVLSATLTSRYAE